MQNTQPRPAEDLAEKILSESSTEPISFRYRRGTQLIIVREGQAEYRLGELAVPLQPNDILLLPRNASHGAVVPLAGHTYRHIVLQVSARTVRNMEELEGVALPEEIVRQGYCLLRTNGTQWEYLAASLEYMLAEAEQQQYGWNSLLYGSSISLLALLARAFHEKNISAYGSADLLNQILHYVERNLGQKITLADTAHRFLVSESTISKLFRSRMATSFYKYVIQRRLAAARQLIAGGYPLERIYMQVGFCDHAAFYRAFRQAYGVSPKQYKAGLPAGDER